MPEKIGTGVIVGRFQVLELNAALRKLIDSVRAQHARTIVFIGSNPAPSDRNPLDWEFRWTMFMETYGDQIEVHEMPDLPDDRIWSQELDRRILELKPEGEITAYGTPNNFIERYSGRHKTKPLEPSLDNFPEFEELGEVRSLRDFRAGMLYATMRRFPTVYPTVDIAVFRNDYREVMLARKANETKYRFPGGFADPTDDSYEEAILRELGEECGELEITDLLYLGSARINDWRYHKSMDAVITHLYTCELTDGTPEPSDDISEIKWFEVTRLKEELFVPEHRPLFSLLDTFLKEER